VVGKKIMVLASWKRISIPKSLSGWGLKNTFFLFSKALDCKNVWSLIQGIGVSAQVTKYK
jgi:hypothetical protein